MIHAVLRRAAAVLVAVVLLSAPALAQKMGSSNRNAPAIRQTMTIGNQSIELGYTAITWAGGQWAAALKDEGSRGEWRVRINESAAKSPLGSLKLTTALDFGGVKVEPGAWKLGFTLNDNFDWQITMIGESGTTVQVPLVLKEVGEASRRLMLALAAGDEDGTAKVVVAFGNSRCDLLLAPAK
jgi:hypothetical protein